MAVTMKTNLGSMKIELFCDLVPKTAKNFLALCASGYYDKTKFHRNIKKFMVQGGDPTGTGKGGKSIYGGYFEDEIVDVLRNDKRGTLAMANRGANTNGSQFFILYDKQPHLNNVNTVFGRVIDGLETLDSIEKIPVDEKDRPIHPIEIISTTVHANPFADADTLTVQPATSGSVNASSSGAK